MWLHRNKGSVTSGSDNIVYLVNDWANSTQSISSMTNSNLLINNIPTTYSSLLTLTPASGFGA
jgi:hypothetical protein